MNSQTILQALIKDQLIDNAKMQAYTANMDNMSMLIAIATGEVASYEVIVTITDELKNNPDCYTN